MDTEIFSNMRRPLIWINDEIINILQVIANSFITKIKRMNNNNIKNSTMKDAVSHMTEAIPATFSNTNLMPELANQIH